MSEGNFYSVNTIFDLAKEFKELECTVQDFEMAYYFLGQGPINGASGEHIKIIADNIEFEVWLDDEGEPIKAKVEGEEIPGAGAPLFVLFGQTPFFSRRFLKIFLKK